jgi:hypothetical protein
VALGRSITRHPCWLPVIACRARPLAVAAGACVTRSKSGCSGAKAETETHGTAP